MFGLLYELACPIATEGELVSLSIYRWSSPQLATTEVHLASEGSGFTRALFAVSTDCGSGVDWAIVKRAGVCISQTGSASVAACNSGVRDEGRMSSTSSMMRSYAVGSTFGGNGEPPSWCAGNCSGVTKAKRVLKASAWKIKKEFFWDFLIGRIFFNRGLWKKNPRERLRSLGWNVCKLKDWKSGIVRESIDVS